MRFLLVFLPYMFTAKASVNTLTCRTLGTVHLNLTMDLTRDLYHDVSDQGFTLVVKTHPDQNSSMAEIKVKESSSTVFSTYETIDYSSEPRVLFDEYIDQFWLECSVD